MGIVLGTRFMPISLYLLSFKGRFPLYCKELRHFGHKVAQFVAYSQQSFPYTNVIRDKQWIPRPPFQTF